MLALNSSSLLGEAALGYGLNERLSCYKIDCILSFNAFVSRLIISLVNLSNLLIVLWLDVACFYCILRNYILNGWLKLVVKLFLVRVLVLGFQALYKGVWFVYSIWIKQIDQTRCGGREVGIVRSCSLDLISLNTCYVAGCRCLLVKNFLDVLVGKCVQVNFELWNIEVVWTCVLGDFWIWMRFHFSYLYLNSLC